MEAGFPASTQEALIIASDIGGIGKVVLDGITGRLVPPGQPIILAEAILNLLNNQAQAVQMRTAAGERARPAFSIEQHVASIEAIYRSLLVRSRRFIAQEAH
jgi:glycosyltransferase involved in cell wall biosynthesis